MSNQAAQRLYDLTFLVSEKTTPENVESIRQNIINLISRHGGEIEKFLPEESNIVAHEITKAASSDPITLPQNNSNPNALLENHSPLKLRHLAYPVANEVRAYLNSITFWGPGELPIKLKNDLRSQAHLLRFMLTRKTKQEKNKDKHRRPVPHPPRPEPQPIVNEDDFNKRLAEIIG